MRHLELFAGIGGFRRALDLIQQDEVMDFNSIGYSEIDSKAIATYTANYDILPDERSIGDIVGFTHELANIEALPDFDLLTAGFPCQPFSMMGKKEGFGEDRGQMFFRIMDVLEAKRPRYVLLENVKNLFTHDNHRTFNEIKRRLRAAGYNVVANIFNTSDFHLPQKRNRVLIFATTENLPDNFEDRFDSTSVASTFDKVYRRLSVDCYDSVLDILEREVDAKYMLSEKIKPTILSDGSGKFVSNSEINQLIVRPLTASMHKMHRACQDNYYSLDFIHSNGKDNPALTMTKDQLAKIPIRKLTPEEAFALQGFPKQFATNARHHGVSDGALYKQAGNAVSVNTIYAVMYYLIVNNIIHE